MDIRNLNDVCSALSDPTRTRILAHLRHNGATSVNALCVAIGVTSQPAVSHHLALLRNARIVDSRREGKNNFYDIEKSDAGALVRYLIDKVEALKPTEAPVKAPAKGKNAKSKVPAGAA